MPFFKAVSKLDTVFEVSIIAKALNGLAELAGGLLLLVIKPEHLTNLARSLTQSELSHDPHDFIASHILHSAEHLSGGATLFGAIYLLLHGITKIVLVFEILRDHLWAYKGMIIFLVTFIIYQIYRIIDKPTFGMIALTIFDSFILVLTIREDKRQHRLAAEADRP